MALEFVKAANDNVDLGNPTLVSNVVGASLACWLRPTAIQAGYIVRFSEGTATSPRIALYALNTGKVQSYGRRLDGGATENVASNSLYAVGSAVHLVAVCRYDAQLIEIWWNGTLDNSAVAPTFTGPTSNTPCQQAYLGHPTGAMDCVVEDVRLYARVLSAQEINNLYYARGRDRETDNAARWKLAEAEPGAAAAGAASVRDTGRAGIHGTPANNPTYREALVSAFHGRRR